MSLDELFEEDEKLFIQVRDNKLKDSKGPDISMQQKIKIIGLYQQAKLGDCNTERPYFFNIMV